MKLLPQSRADFTAISSESTKTVCFDAVRGLAAFAVMMSHIVLAFWPGMLFRVGPIWDESPGWLQAIVRFPLRFLLHGRLAVFVFFVLSGFVLSLAFFQSGSTAALGSAARRRYPRLMIPVAASVLAAYFLMSAGAMCNRAAIVEMNDAYGFPQAPDPAAKPGCSYGWLATYYDFEPSLPGALRDATWGAFVRPCPYNWPLHTMPTELLGSFLVFGFLALFGAARNRWLLCAIAGGLCFVGGPEGLIDFVAGIALGDIARWNRDTWRKALPLLPALAIIAAAIFAVSWEHVSAVLIVGAVVVSPPLQKALSGRWLVTLGQASFALYVLHMPLLCSVGCGLYLVGRRTLEWPHTLAALVAVGLFLPIVILAAWLFHRFVDRPTLALVRWVDDALFRPVETSTPATVRRAA